ncbi:MAG: carboxyl transferase [Clostridiales bacterium]|jgi:acetyl-CoA carboxylase carboxyltransferase component|nr:carboxyl transferase [Clostridiales bacterium]
MSNRAQLSARERITSLLDDNSFVEVGAFITKRSTDFNLDQKDIPNDGVITGYGLIDGNPVYVFSQDSSSLGGSVGEMHAKKIVAIYDLALKVGAPVIGLLDSTGMRLQESTDALNGFGEIYSKQIMASGVIPQITAIFGNSGGGLSVMASLSDFSFMEKNNARLFMQTPNSLLGNSKEKLDTSSADFNAKSGAIDFVGDTELEVLNKIRELISIIPSNNEEEVCITECSDDLNRLVPSFSQNLMDVKNAIIDISDNNYFLEIKSAYALEIVTGFIRLNGLTIGAIANRTTDKAESVITTDGCKKAASFVRFCDAFNIPILTLTNVIGYKADVNEEKTISKAIAELTYAFTDATVPKVNVITGKAYGSAYISMNSKHIGADYVFALPNAEIGMMDPKLAAQIMYEGESSEVINEKSTQYASLQNGALSAAKRGYVDNIIEPETVRKHVIYAFEMLYNKSEARPLRKHGTL